MSEYQAAIPLELENSEVSPARCGEDNGRLRVRTNRPQEDQVEYAILPGPFQLAPEFSGLVAGTYVLRARDQYACTEEHQIQIPGIEGPRFSILKIIPSRCDRPTGSIQFSLEAGRPPYLFRLDQGLLPFTPPEGGLSPGLHHLLIEDQNGCILEHSFEIPAEACDFYLPMAFSPNGDGKNDVFQVYAHPNIQVEVRSFRIFNRWGQLVFENRSRDLQQARWEGKEAPPPGAYVYQIELALAEGKTELLSGEISLIR